MVRYGILLEEPALFDKAGYHFQCYITAVIDKHEVVTFYLKIYSELKQSQ